MVKRVALNADETGAVRELRLVVTADDYEAALRFYRDVLGLRERAAFASPGGRVTILEAGRATLELTDPSDANSLELAERAAGGTRRAAADAVQRITRAPPASTDVAARGRGAAKVRRFRSSSDRNQS
jgi:lactoylglutathione lyase